MTIASGIGTRVKSRLLNEQYEQQATALACSVAHEQPPGSALFKSSGERGNRSAPVLGRCRTQLHTIPLDERTPVRFRLDVALYLGDAARVGRKVSYGELTARFGNPPEGWGAILAAIASGLRKRGAPLLPVLVVAVDTGLPPVKAAIYRQFGLSGEDAIRGEQKRCFEFDWPAVFFCEAPTKDTKLAMHRV